MFDYLCKDFKYYVLVCNYIDKGLRVDYCTNSFLEANKYINTMKKRYLYFDYYLVSYMDMEV